MKLSKCSSKHRYVSVHIKFAVALGGALAWAGVAIWLAQRWLGELSALAGPVLAHLMIYGIAVIPGFMNCFLILSLLFDRRPEFLPENAGGQLPAITILVAAYNEAENIQQTLASIEQQEYPGGLSVIVINDGSRDATLQRLEDKLGKVTVSAAVAARMKAIGFDAEPGTGAALSELVQADLQRYGALIRSQGIQLDDTAR